MVVSPGIAMIGHFVHEELRVMLGVPFVSKCIL